MDMTYYITDNRLWLSVNGQAHLPIDPNELVAGYEKRIAELEAANTQLQYESDMMSQDNERMSRLLAEREPTEAPF